MLCLFWRSVLHGYRRKESEQLTLPFGTLIGAETSATNDKRFTSYDRSEIAGGLDYAVNRNYNSGQSRFTQVDPIGMASTSIENPQSMNLFAYVQNNPISFVDPTGLLLAIRRCETVTTIILNDDGSVYAQWSNTTCETSFVNIGNGPPNPTSGGNIFDPLPPIGGIGGRRPDKDTRSSKSNKCGD